MFAPFCRQNEMEIKATNRIIKDAAEIVIGKYNQMGHSHEHMPSVR